LLWCCFLSVCSTYASALYLYSSTMFLLQRAHVIACWIHPVQPPSPYICREIDASRWMHVSSVRSCVIFLTKVVYDNLDIYFEIILAKCVCVATGIEH
jgi:hypothetical protein